MRTFLLFLSLVMALGLRAADETVVPSKITAVDIYRQRAQLHQEGTATVKAGDNLLIFTGLSQYIIPNSVTVKGEGKGIIQSVKHRINYLTRTDESARVKAIRDSISVIEDELAVISDELFVFNEEEKVVLKNSQLGSQHEAFGVENVAEIADLYRKRLAEIRNLKRALLKRQRDNNEKISHYRLELQNIQNERSQAMQEVVVAFKAEAAGTVKLELAYMVTNVSWEPFYDVRVAGTASPIALTLKANVINNTGINWEKVKISLSTAVNDGRTQAPVLNPQYVSVYVPQVYGYAAGGVAPMAAPAPAYKSDSRAFSPASNSMDMEEQAVATSSAAFTTMNEGTLAMVFDISILYDIPADGKETQVDIYNMDLKGDYRHFSVPKLDLETYLVAYIHQDLLRGKANVYFEGTFVGETFINTDNPQDSMQISLGKDPKVQISRTQVKDFSRRKVIGGTAEQQFAFEIVVRNNKKEVVSLSLQDQIPVSQNADIKVEVLDLAGATLAPDTGKLVWDLKLQPGETKKITFKYQVTYPKDANISGL